MNALKSSPHFWAQPKSTRAKLLIADAELKLELQNKRKSIIYRNPRENWKKKRNWLAYVRNKNIDSQQNPTEFYLRMGKIKRCAVCNKIYHRDEMLGHFCARCLFYGENKKKPEDYWDGKNMLKKVAEEMRKSI